MIDYEIVSVAVISYLIMVFAYFQSRHRWLHMPVMSSIILFDLAMPFYLYASRDWYKRLIEQEEIFSFLIWLHVGLVITLYGLYYLQIMSARKMINGEEEARSDHRSQGKAILLVRGLVVATAAILVKPETAIGE